jgi:arsenate reductase
MSQSKKRVLFICTHNSARSQMAEAFLRYLYGDRYEAFSGGTHPSSINPLVTKAMREIGIDLATHRAKSVNEFKSQQFDVVVTVCDHAKETCPFFPGAKKYLHQNFEDPSQFVGTEKTKLEKFRRVRDSIKAWIEDKFEC